MPFSVPTGAWPYLPWVVGELMGGSRREEEAGRGCRVDYEERRWQSEARRGADDSSRGKGLWRMSFVNGAPGGGGGLQKCLKTWNDKRRGTDDVGQMMCLTMNYKLETWNRGANEEEGREGGDQTE